MRRRTLVGGFVWTVLVQHRSFLSHQLATRPGHTLHYLQCVRTVWSGNLAPNNPDLWSSDLLLCAVDESNLLSEVEANNPSVSNPYGLVSVCNVLGRVGVVNALDLDQAGTWGSVALSTGVAQVTTPTRYCISILSCTSPILPIQSRIFQPYLLSSGNGSNRLFSRSYGFSGVLTWRRLRQC